MSAYTICKELLPPQTVEHVEKAHFTSPYKVNVIVARGTLLEIYDFVEHVVEPEPTELADEENDGTDQEATIKERFDQDKEQVIWQSTNAKLHLTTIVFTIFSGSGISKASADSVRYFSKDQVRTIGASLAIQAEWYGNIHGSS